MHERQTSANVASPESAGAGEGAKHTGQKFLTFLLDHEEYGLEILKVRELIGIMEITKVPQTCDFVEGVINLRGKVIPVIDLRTKFGLPRLERNDQSCIIVVDAGALMGIIVDAVHEVHDIPARDIEPPPALGGHMETNFILGMGKVNGAVTILLDIDKVLTGDQLVCTRSRSGG
jgi:purine-binding chemotaxis protein CheW